jgi:hypothetical protein
MELFRKALPLVAAAVGGAVWLVAASSSAQDGPRIGATQNTVETWHQLPNEWRPPAPGRVAADWVFGDRYNLEEVVIWNPVKRRLLDGEDIVGLTMNYYNEEDYCRLAAAGYHFSWMEQQHAPLDI